MARINSSGQLSLTQDIGKEAYGTLRNQNIQISDLRNDGSNIRTVYYTTDERDRNFIYNKANISFSSFYGKKKAREVGYFDFTSGGYTFPIIQSFTNRTSNGGANVVLSNYSTDFTDAIIVVIYAAYANSSNYFSTDAIQSSVSNSNIGWVDTGGTTIYSVPGIGGNVTIGMWYTVYNSNYSNDTIQFVLKHGNFQKESMIIYGFGINNGGYDVRPANLTYSTTRSVASASAISNGSSNIAVADVSIDFLIGYTATNTATSWGPNISGYWYIPYNSPATPGAYTSQVRRTNNLFVGWYVNSKQPLGGDSGNIGRNTPIFTQMSDYGDYNILKVVSLGVY